MCNQTIDDSYVLRDADLAFAAPSVVDSEQHNNGTGQELDLLLEESFLTAFLFEDEGNTGAEHCLAPDVTSTYAKTPATATPGKGSGQREVTGQYPGRRLLTDELYCPLEEERTSPLGIEPSLLSGSNDHIEMAEKVYSTVSESENRQEIKGGNAAVECQTASHGNGSEVDGPIASGAKRQRSQVDEKLKESRINSTSDLLTIDTDAAADDDPDSKAKKEKRLEKNRASAALSRERKKIRMDRLEAQVKPGANRMYTCRGEEEEKVDQRFFFLKKKRRKKKKRKLILVDAG